jgi:hypothetical protein
MPERRRRNGAGTTLAIGAAVLLIVALAGCSGGSGGGGGDGGAGSAADRARLLGPDKKATGSPVKVGVVSDGKADGADSSAGPAATQAVVDYANEHLGGINGHVIELDLCVTGGVPSGGTNCGAQMVRDRVAAVLVAQSGQSATIFAALEGSGISYVSWVAIDPALFVSPGAFVLTNPIASVGAGIALAKEKGNHHAAIVFPDVPAASGLGAITDPVYAKANIQLSTVPIGISTPDVTPQIQQALGSGVDQFQIAGTDELITATVKALGQLDFKGTTIVASDTVGPMLAEQVPGGPAGTYELTNTTRDPSDPDVQLFGAVMDTYASGTPKDDFAVTSYGLALGFVRALAGATAAVDAPTVMTALSNMPAPVALPMGGGITIQCGSKPVSFAPSICTGQTLQSTLDEQGRATDSKVVDVSAYTKLT